MRTILSIDQSTQGTKALFFDENGNILARSNLPHRQIVNERGWVSHDPEEIYRNTVQAARDVIVNAGVDRASVAAVGISNQRETTVAWDEAGTPIADAVVWQCARAESIAKRLADRGEVIRQKTGIPLSPYFPAAKMAWLMENAVTDRHGLHLGTIDTWLVYKLTGGEVFKTDFSNASRTQLFNLHTLKWDEKICHWFGVPVDALPEVTDSNDDFGETDLEGFLPKKVPIRAVMGDSHAALYGQGCHRPSMVKTTYGTGSSIMMNVGENFIESKSGLVTSLAWGIGGKVEYVIEGNINYTGAVISWLKDDVGLIQSAGETEALARAANPADTTILVPAFSGLGAPYWKGDAKAIMTGMTRTTGRNEIVKAGLESIAYQINDVLAAMEADCGESIAELRVDGGPTKNGYLMQFQADLSDVTVCAAMREELSAIGAAYLAGITAGIYDKAAIFAGTACTKYVSAWNSEQRSARLALWKEAVGRIL